MNTLEWLGTLTAIDTTSRLSNLGLIDLARRAHAPFWHRPGAHVTLSRDALGVAPPRLPQAIDWPVSEVCLVWLQLTPEVGRRHYEVLATCGASEALVAPAQLSFGFQ